MYGRAFESMYEGSMVGIGVKVWAVWNYVIAKAKRGVIELNPKILAFILGGITEQEIEEAIEVLCAPDPKSRSKAHDGRRLVREGEYQYAIVNWEKYNVIRNETDRREYNRLKQREYRARKEILESQKTLAKQAREAGKKQHRSDMAALGTEANGSPEPRPPSDIRAEIA